MAGVQSAVQLVEVEEMEEYPIPTGERLDSHFFMNWHYRRWRHSEFRMLADKEVRAVAFELFNVAQEEDPVGTLPVDERLLAKLVGEPLEVWQALCKRDIGPLYGWRLCRTDRGVTRYCHDVVTEVSLKALGRRLDQIEKLEGDRERKRMAALPDQMLRAGAHKGMTEDPDFLAGFDQFLLEEYPNKQRRVPVVREALGVFSLKREGLA